MSEIDINNAEVILYLEVSISSENRSKFLEFCRRAFPVYESVGNNKMMLYESTKEPNHFNEVGYYLTFDDYKRAEYAIEHDPIQSDLIREWRSLLGAPPLVKIYQKIPE